MKTSEEIQSEIQDEETEACLKVIEFLKGYPLERQDIVQHLRNLYKHAKFTYENESEILKRMKFSERAKYKEYWREGGAKEIMSKCMEQAKYPEVLDYEYWIQRNDIDIIKKWGYDKWLQEAIFFGRPFIKNYYATHK